MNDPRTPDRTAFRDVALMTVGLVAIGGCVGLAAHALTRPDQVTGRLDRIDERLGRLEARPGCSYTPRPSQPVPPHLRNGVIFPGGVGDVVPESN